MLFVASLLAVGWMTSLLLRNGWCHPFCSTQSCLVLSLKLTFVYSVIENKNSSGITCMPNFIKIGQFSLTHTHAYRYMSTATFFPWRRKHYIYTLFSLSWCVWVHVLMGCLLKAWIWCSKYFECQINYDKFGIDCKICCMWKPLCSYIIFVFVVVCFKFCDL